jgi:ubiquinone biosynthesis protein
VLDELDLQREAANTAQLRRNFIDSDLLYVPEVHWDFSRRDVFVMERIHGIPVSDVTRLRAAGTDMKELAERGVRIFFTQVFRDSFFHADMHPGNIFVDVADPLKPRYIGIDCAIMGSLSDFDQYYLARNLLAIFQRRYREVAELHIECGWVPPQTRVQDFEAAIRSACEPIFEKPLGQISFGQLLIYLFQTARRFDMEVQPSLVLLQKTLLHIEGLGRQLYPELDLWATAKPFLEQWVADRYSPRALLEKLQKRAPAWLEQLPQRPEALRERLDSLLRAGPQPGAPREPAPAPAPARWRAWELAIAVVGMVLLNPHTGADPLAWHPATWACAALAAHALLARRALL